MGEFIDFRYVKERADFMLVLARYDIEVTGRGAERRGLCPFHDDTDPSLSVNVERKVFQCFGCKARGNVLEFVAKMEECDLRTAAKTLAECCGIGLSDREEQRAPVAEEAQERPKRRRSAKGTRKAPDRTQRRGKEAAVVNKPLTFTLPLDASHPYLAERCPSPEVVDEFGLGYYDGRGMLAGRICIPIHNETGELVGYCGRWPGDEVPKGEQKYLLPDRFQKSRVLFNLNRLNGAVHVVLVESYFSVFRLHALGVAVVSPMGSSVSEAQACLLAGAGISNVTVLFDGDDAGRKSAETVVPALARRFFVHLAELPAGAKPHSVDEAELAKVVDLP
jgi:DNA primase